MLIFILPSQTEKKSVAFFGQEKHMNGTDFP